MILSQESSQRDRQTVEKISRYLKIILLRSQTPINITAGKFYVISLENYKNVSIDVNLIFFFSQVFKKIIFYIELDFISIY